MASIFDLYIEQGSTFKQVIDLEGDWTGNTISISIIDSIGAQRDASCYWSDIENGEFTIHISSEQSGLIKVGVGKYNIEITNELGDVKRLIQGRIYNDGDVK